MSGVPLMSERVIKNILIIANPIAGGGKARLLVERLTALLARNRILFETFFTQKAGDARTRAAAVSDTYGALVVCGGDGTLNEVINGLDDLSKMPISFLPAGTGNVLAHELKLAGTPEETLAAVTGGRVRRIDVGIASGRRFLMLASAGFDALVTREIKKTRKGVLGYHRYAFPILRSLFLYRPPQLQVEVDGRRAFRCGLVIVGKTPYYGGLFNVAPKAGCDTGTFEVSVFRSGGRVYLFSYAVAALCGCLAAQSGITHCTGKKIRITSPRPVPVEIDGDYAGTTPLELDVVPAGLKLLQAPK